MMSSMRLEELKDGKKNAEDITKDQLIEKYEQLDKKVESVLAKIKRRQQKKRYEEFFSFVQ